MTLCETCDHAPHPGRTGPRGASRRACPEPGCRCGKIITRARESLHDPRLQDDGWACRLVHLGPTTPYRPLTPEEQERIMAELRGRSWT